MNYVKGNLIEYMKAYKAPVFVPHVVNDANAMGAGVARALFEYDENVKKYYHWWFQQSLKHDMIDTTGRAKLGNCQFIRSTELITIVNMVGQSDPGVVGFEYFDTKGKKQLFKHPPIRYDSLIECMFNVLRQMQKEKVQDILTVKFGCGLAGGSYEIIEQLIKSIWCDNGISVTVVEP